MRAAAERAAALGSHEQAVTFLEQALEITTDPADRADLHERAVTSASEGLSVAIPVRHAEGALAARREQGDREGIAAAAANLCFTLVSVAADPGRAVEVTEPVLAEFADLENTAAGVKLTSTLASAYGILGDRAKELALLDRVIPIAERLDAVDTLVGALIARGSALAMHDRPREGLLLVRGAHSMALSGGLRRRERGARNMLVFLEQWSDPSGGLDLARDGLEVARQVGSKIYAVLMAGNGAACAIRVGDFDWVTEVFDELIPPDVTDTQFVDLVVWRAAVKAIRGADPSGDIELASGMAAGQSDPQFEQYEAMGRAWAALSAGALAEARKQGLRAAGDASTTNTFLPLGLPLAARASLWARDLTGARAALSALTEATQRGPALTLDKRSIEAGIVALDGRTGEALALYRDTLRGWRGINLAWDEVLTVIDMVTLLGVGDPESRAAADWARAALERMGARPYLDRLDAALAGGPAGPVGPAAGDALPTASAAGRVQEGATAR